MDVGLDVDVRRGLGRLTRGGAEGSLLVALLLLLAVEAPGHDRIRSVLVVVVGLVVLMMMLVVVLLVLVVAGVLGVVRWVLRRGRHRTHGVAERIGGAVVVAAVVEALVLLLLLLLFIILLLVVLLVLVVRLAKRGMNDGLGHAGDVELGERRRDGQDAGLGVAIHAPQRLRLDQDVPAGHPAGGDGAVVHALDAERRLLMLDLLLAGLRGLGRRLGRRRLVGSVFLLRLRLFRVIRLWLLLRLGFFRVIRLGLLLRLGLDSLFRLCVSLGLGTLLLGFGDSLVILGLELAGDGRDGGTLAAPHERAGGIAELHAHGGGADASAPRGARDVRLAPREGVQVQRVNVAEELLALVVLAADDVHHAVLVNRGVEPALRRGEALRVNLGPLDVSRVGEVGVVRGGGRVRGAPAGVVPHAAAPHPHPLLVVHHGRVLVAADG